jgi:hypothetical protein
MRGRLVKGRLGSWSRDCERDIMEWDGCSTVVGHALSIETDSGLCCLFFSARR